MEVEFNHMEEFGWLGANGIQETCGTILSWLSQLERNKVEAENITDHILLAYGFPADPMTGGRFEGDVYKYPEDPDMVPMMTIKLTCGVVVYMYLYGMVAFEVNGVTTLYRLD